MEVDQGSSREAPAAVTPVKQIIEDDITTTTTITTKKSRLKRLFSHGLARIYQTFHRRDPDPDHEFCRSHFFREEIAMHPITSFVVEYDVTHEHLSLLFAVYAALRALDGVEDSPASSFGSTEERIHLLRNFHEKLEEPEWSLAGVGSNARDHEILEHWSHTSRLYLKQSAEKRAMMKDTVRRMGDGMAEYHPSVKLGGIVTMDEYNDYSYKASVLVFEGVFRLVDELADIHAEEAQSLLRELGTFLLKADSVEDVYEDHQLDAVHWPSDIWSKYVKSFDELFERANEGAAIDCLNEFCMDAIHHLPGAIRLASKLRRWTFRRMICMDVTAHLAMVTQFYNSYRAFEGVGKIHWFRFLCAMSGATNIRLLKMYSVTCLKAMKRKAPDERQRDIVRAIIREVRNGC